MQKGANPVHFFFRIIHGESSKDVYPPPDHLPGRVQKTGQKQFCRLECSKIIIVRSVAIHTDGRESCTLLDFLCDSFHIGTDDHGYRTCDQCHQFRLSFFYRLQNTGNQLIILPQDHIHPAQARAENCRSGAVPPRFIIQRIISGAAGSIMQDRHRI